VTAPSPRPAPGAGVVEAFGQSEYDRARLDVRNSRSVQITLSGPRATSTASRASSTTPAVPSSNGRFLRIPVVQYVAVVAKVRPRESGARWPWCFRIKYACGSRQRLPPGKRLSESSGRPECRRRADLCSSRAMLEGRCPARTCCPRRLKMMAGSRGSLPRMPLIVWKPSARLPPTRSANSMARSHRGALMDLLCESCS
jgi:hypothetical protein